MSRHISQELGPWNVRFARDLPNDSPFAPREALAGKDARTLSLELLAMSPSGFSAAFQGSPMKRAKLRGLKRNAAVVLGNVGTPEEVEVLARVLDVPSHSSTSTPSDRRVAWPAAHANASAGTPALIPLRPRG